MESRRAVITGGANGIGAATARLFASEGAAVAIADLARMEDRALALVAEIESAGGRAYWQPMDVRDIEGSKAAIDAAAEAMGGIDTVVASAGVGQPPGHVGSFTNLLNLDVAAFDAVQEVNVRGVFVTLQRAAQLMVEAGHGGSMVAIGSMASKRPTGGAYSVSKAAVWMLTRTLAQELGPLGIRVNAIGPGYVETDLFDGIARNAAPEGPEAQAKWREGRRAQVVLGRFGTPQDIANTALFLCSDEGAYFTGSILHPDGGYTSTFGGG
jgi:NAD(P)-dependent dehydrogenase (short-subunit alcohol dehydrogenase family)